MFTDLFYRVFGIGKALLIVGLAIYLMVTKQAPFGTLCVAGAIGVLWAILVNWAFKKEK